MRRTIAIGDVHGCLEELDELLKMVEYNKHHDRLVLLGDLVDRGPDSLGVVRRARELNAQGVMGNHDEKHIRYRMHEKRALHEAGYTNPMKPFTEQRWKEHWSLTDDDLRWLSNLPLIINLRNDWVGVHAGFEPARKLHEQKTDKLLRIRYVDAQGKAVPIYNDFDAPPGTERWATRWKYPHHVVYGHHAINMDTPHIEHIWSGDEHHSHMEPSFKWMRVALDTACCFGGTLSALLLPRMNLGGHVPFQTCSVKAKATYATPWKGDE